MNITGGKYNRQKIKAPDESITRPTLSKVRMSVFNTLASITDFEGKSFLDMYAGSGIMGLEALSRGVERVVGIEKNRKVYNITKSNYFQYQKMHNLKLIFGDSLKVCSKFSEKFDIIYIDPPYYSNIYEQSLEVVKNICNDVVILEHVVPVKYEDNFEILKQKKYSDKYITFLRPIC